MAPAYRNSNRRQNRTGLVDHDVFEGLPVRHWRRDYVTVAPPQTQESNSSQNDIWAVELPHGMPKDSHLLPQHSQDLLRAARSGRIYKRPAPAEEEEVDVEALIGEKPEKKEDDPKDRGFTAKAWKQIPRHLEGPDVEYLAKRRKGLITVAAKPASAGPTLTKATVKRIDAAGNEYVQDVVVSHGEKLEGEVISQTTIPDPSASGLGDGFAPTPKRKGPPPRRKPKGPGRGRKKKVIAPTSAPQVAPVDGAQTAESTAIGPDGIKNENEPVSTPANNEDTEMADGSMHDSDDDEEGEEGEDGEDDDEGSADPQSSPSKPPPPAVIPPSTFPSINEIPNIGRPDVAMGGTEATAPPPLLHIERDRIEGKAGSPLKNVALTTSTLTSPLESPSATAPPPFPEPIPAQAVSHTFEPIQSTESPVATLNEAMQEETMATAPPSLPPPPPEPTAAETKAATELLQEEEEEEEMLLDIVDNANNANIGGAEMPPSELPLSELSPIAAPEPIPEAPIDDIPAPAPQVTEAPVPETIPSEAPEPEIVQEAIAAPEEPQIIEEAQPEALPAETPQQPIEEDDDDFPDLLGGLEKQLNEPAPVEVLAPFEVPAPVAEPLSPPSTEQVPLENPVESEVAAPIVEEAKVVEPVEEKSEDA